MKVGSNQSWVALVENDRQGWEALVLATSLKRHLTQRRLTALIHSLNVSQPMQNLLRKNFDFVETLQNASVVWTGKPFEGKSSKNFLWTLTLWKKCVFLASNLLVLEPIEHLFDLEEFSAPVAEVRGQYSMNLDLFVLKPNREMVKALNTSKAQGDKGILNHFWKTWTSSPTKKIQDTVMYGVLPEEHHLHSPRPKTIKFEASPWTTKEGKSWQKYSSAWLKIFTEEIFPQTQKTEEMRKFFEESASTLQFPIVAPMARELGSADSTDDLTDSIAIVGMSGRFPGANNVQDYWNLLTEGRCAVRKFPEGRRTFDIPGIETLVGGFLSCAVDEFDAKFFGISPREAPVLDPQQRLLLEVIWESLEDAGIDGSTLKNTPVGVFIGVLTQDYDRMLPRNGYIGNEYHHRFLGNAMSAIAGRVSHFMGFTGPNMAVESGDSSSLAALHLGCRSLLSGESNLVISGCVNLVIIPRHHNVPVVSADNRIIAYDPKRDGAESSEGVATLVLKRYADAIRDGDHIRAIIRGSAMGNDGGSLCEGTSVASPSEQAHVFNQALANAGVKPSDVSYVEAHGCSKVGEVSGASALAQVYAKRADSIWIGSLTPNIGNAESAAGIAAIIKLVLSLENDALPITLNGSDLYQKMAWKSFIKAKFPSQLTPWTGPRRLCATSSVSITGTIVHTVLQLADSMAESSQEKARESANPELILISAKTPEALESQRKNYLKFFASHENYSLREIAYATNLCRTHFSHRLAIVARNKADLVRKLESRDYIGGKIPSNSKSPPVAFLFTGQTSEYLGMSKGLYRLFKPFRATIDFCSDIFHRLTHHSLTSVLFENETLLHEFAQPAIFCVQIALVKLYSHFGIRPTVVLGHSVGEYCAAVAADVMSIEDGLKLVIGRSELVRKLQPGGMLAIKGTLAEAQELVALAPFSLDIAAINSPSQVILSGSIEQIQQAEQVAATRGVKTHRLQSLHAFHSRHVEPILADFGALAQGISYNPPRCAYISSTHGRLMTTDDFRPEYWQCHLRDTIQFSRAIELLTSMSTTLIEIGPQPVLLGLAMANKLSSKTELVCCPSLRRTEENFFTFYNAMASLHVTGVTVDWRNYFGWCQKTVKLPTYPFQRQSYWFALKDYTVEEDDKDRGGIFLNAKRVHPILGYEIAMPEKMTFAQSKLLKELPYLKDCTLANAPFVTAGAMIELFLKASQLVTGDRKLAVRNLEFIDYLRLDSEKSIQTVVDNDVATVYVEEAGGEWSVVAKGQINGEPVANNQVPKYDWTKELEGAVELQLDDIYSSGVQAQVYYGNVYRRVDKAWRLRSGAVVTELKTMVQDPEVIGRQDGSYVAFPTVLDAMIQSAYFSSKNDSQTICLPSKLDLVSWLGLEAPSGQLMVYCDSTMAHLVTKSGQLIATLAGPVFKTDKGEYTEVVVQKGIPADLSLLPKDTSHITMPLDTDDQRLQILADIIARPAIAGEDVIERELDTSGRLQLEHEPENLSLADKLTLMFRQTLRLPADDALDWDQNFIEVGVDSLMGLEIGAKIQSMMVDLPISATVVQEFPTMRTLLAELERF